MKKKIQKQASVKKIQMKKHVARKKEPEKGRNKEKRVQVLREEKNEFRLPAHIRPVHYDIVIEPDLKKFTFQGKEKIHVVIENPSREILLNAVDLKMSEVIIGHNGKALKASVRYDAKHEQVILSVKEKVQGNATISLSFEGKMNDNLTGLYRSRYLDGKGKEHWLATTQFESTYARNAFPCFDEPDKKASFAISLVVEKDMETISNMHMKETANVGKKKIVRFFKTPVMSTYLVYFGAGNFEFLEGTYRDVKLRIATTPGNKLKGKFALECTQKFLKYFEEFSGITYPLPKLDLIAIPDFAFGAMENWGAITFREILLLYDKEKTSTAVKKRIAEVIAHELWHQWSGNLVTMKWWDDLWLNESFATFMAFKAVAKFFPEWNIWEDFVRSETEGAMAQDSLLSSHPIQVTVRNPEEAQEIFDSISYGKGGSVLRMIEGYIGEDAFRKGVANYLLQFKYRNAAAADLWSSLEKHSETPIKAVMENWVQQTGFPLIEAKISENKILLSQQRFCHAADSGKIWKIPLVMRTNLSNELTRKLMENRQEEILLPETPEWIKLNYLEKGFYRTQYQEQTLAALQPLIAGAVLSSFDRWGIQNDVFTLSLIQKGHLDEYLKLLKAYAAEDNYFVLAEIYQNLYRIFYIFSQDESWKEIEVRFREHCKGPFLKLYERLGWNASEKENEKDSLLRELALNFLMFIEEPKVVKEGYERFRNHYVKGSPLHPDVRSAVYSAAATMGSTEDFEKVMKLYLKAKIPEEKVKLLRTLAKFKDEAHIAKALDFFFSKNVRIQDLRTAVPALTSNPSARSVLYPWIVKNWSKLKVHQKNGKVFMDILESFIAFYGTEKRVEIEKLLRKEKVGYEQVKKRAFEIMERNTAWLKSNARFLREYFLEE